MCKHTPRVRYVNLCERWQESGADFEDKRQKISLVCFISLSYVREVGRQDCRGTWKVNLGNEVSWRGTKSSESGGGRKGQRRRARSRDSERASKQARDKRVSRACSKVVLQV